MRRFLGLPAVALAAFLVAGCSGSSSAPTSVTAPHGRIAPDLNSFLALPKATPGTCPKNENGTTVGRASPWVGTVDVSIFMSPKSTTRQVLALGDDLRTDPLVEQAYFESQKQAYEEFQRLYTCWASVPKSQTPPSYRLVLKPTTTIATRDLLVKRIAAKSDVDSVSCDPALPCVNIIESETPKPVASHTHRA